MSNLPDQLINRLARRKLATELIGTPVNPNNARFVPSLYSKNRGTETVVYVHETGASITHHTPETAKALVDTLAELERQDREKASSRGVRGRVELKNRVELETGQEYGKYLSDAKEIVREYPDELLSMML